MIMSSSWRQMSLMLLLISWLPTFTDAYHMVMLSGNSEFFEPIEKGWFDECDAIGDDVTCEYIQVSGANLANYSLPYNRTEDVRSCVPFMRYLINRGDVDAMAVKCNLVDPENDPPVFQQAMDAGIPTVVFAGPHAGPYISYIGANNKEEGRSMARLLKQLRPEGGTYVATYNGPSSGERAAGFVEEIEKDNNRDDKATWIEEPNLNYTALGWDQSDFKGVTGRGWDGIPWYLDILGEANPTAVCFMYQTPMRHENYTDFVDKNRHKGMSFVSRTVGLVEWVESGMVELTVALFSSWELMAIPTISTI